MPDTLVATMEDGKVGGRHAVRPVRRNRWSRRVAADVVAFADIIAAIAATYATRALMLPEAAHDAGEPATFQLSLVTALVMHYALRQAGMYDTRDMARFPSRIRDLVGPVCFSFLFVFVVAHSLKLPGVVPIHAYGVLLLAGLGFVAAERAIARAYLRARVAEGRFDTNLAIFGAGLLARRIRDQLTDRPGGVRVVGIYEDRSPDRVDTDGLEISGTFEDLLRDGRAGRIDRVIIALPQHASERIADLSKRLEQLPVHLQICTHVAHEGVYPQNAAQRLTSLGPVGLLDLKQRPIKDWGALVKKLEDYTVASLALVLTAPVFALAALAIRLDSPGPVFYRQKRHGLGYAEIDVLKFRTMRVAETGGNISQASRNDPRVTRVGRLLRMTSLDELPQLINVLRGEMSIVGPRPHAVVHNEQYGKILERYANRHKVKPGMTGWAQINGFRGETRLPDAMRRRVEHDLYYIDNWSFRLDLWIIACTPFYGLVSRNAY